MTWYNQLLHFCRQTLSAKKLNYNFCKCFNSPSVTPIMLYNTKWLHTVLQCTSICVCSFCLISHLLWNFVGFKFPAQYWSCVCQPRFFQNTIVRILFSCNLFELFIDVSKWATSFICNRLGPCFCTHDSSTVIQVKNPSTGFELPSG